ncbi:MAG TPA: hypothetical protein V6D26_09935 [Stenomitos sp.]
MAEKSLKQMNESEIRAEIQLIKDKPEKDKTAADYREITKLTNELTARHKTELKRLTKLKGKFEKLVSEINPELDKN